MSGHERARLLWSAAAAEVAGRRWKRWPTHDWNPPFTRQRPGVKLALPLATLYLRNGLTLSPALA